MRTRLRKNSPFQPSGIALFILMASLVAISLGFKELLQMSSASALRVQNATDRIQAMMLARSSLNVERLFISFDRYMDALAKDGAYDGPDDYWAKPIPFP